MTFRVFEKWQHRKKRDLSIGGGPFLAAGHTHAHDFLKMEFQTYLSLPYISDESE